MCIRDSGLYLVARAELGGEPEVLEDSRAFAREYLGRYVVDGLEPEGQHGSVEGRVATTAFLAASEARAGGLDDLTRRALDHAWELQSEEGHWEDWLKCHWPPYEVDDHFGVTLMAVALGTAPADYLATPAAREGRARLRGYLAAHPPRNLHQKGMLLWAAASDRALVDPTDREVWVGELLGLQRADGGWALVDLGDERWVREDGSPQDQSSDAYATAFAVLALRRAGVEAPDACLRRGLDWLRANQRASGRWFVRSPRRDRHHYLSHAATNLALMAFAACGSGLEADRADPPEEAIDRLFERWDDPDSPGASVAVIREGEVVFARGYGCAQLEYGVPIGPDTVFHVASVSKQLTAMAVALLAVEGKLGLDDEIAPLVEGFPDLGHPITLRQLLHHTSGLRDQWALLALAGWRLDDVITRDHVLTLVRGQRELNFPPGERHLYCNTGYTLLGVAVETVSGQSFSEFTRERIFEPLGMASTHFHDDHEHLVPNRAYSYGRTRDGFEKRVLSYANAGATSLFTTATDLVRWLDNLDHGRVGGPEALARMQERGVLSSGEPIDYALGVVHGRHDGWRTLGHSGADAGFRSHAVWFPEARLGVAVLSNLQDFDAAGRAERVADLYLEGLRPPDSADAPRPLAARPAPPPEPVRVDRAVLAGYEGRYRSEQGHVLSLEQAGRNLYARAPGGPRMRLRPESPTAFTARTGGSRLVLEERDDGAGWSFLLELGGATRRFEPHAEDEAPGPDLDAYTGLYHSDELSALYEIAVEGGDLVARHVRHGLIELRPSWPDRFTSPRWFFRSLEFERDSEGSVTGLRVSSDRALNVSFGRL